MRPALIPAACCNLARSVSATACVPRSHHAALRLPRPSAAFFRHNPARSPWCSSLRSVSTGRSVQLRPLGQFLPTRQRAREFSSEKRPPSTLSDERASGVRLSTLLSKHLGLSRRQSERMILTERVTLFGKVIANPAFVLRPSPDPNQDSSTAMKVDGKLIQGVDKTLKALYEDHLQNAGDPFEDSSDGGKQKTAKKNEYAGTRVWLANKLRGELVTEHDPVGRPSLLQRLTRGGVGKGARNANHLPTHLKPVGRLDMMTEGLMILTNDGNYARELELPGNNLWRTYRVRVHGRLTPGKLKAMRQGLTVRVNDDPIGGGDRDRNPSGEVVRTGRLMNYKGVKVSIERQRGGGRGRGGGGTNTWLRITCTEGKNRQIRRILGALGLDATRLIRISFGDYDLNTIPPGRAMEVPCKGLAEQKKKGPLFAGSKKKRDEDKEESAPGVQWVNYR